MLTEHMPTWRMHAYRVHARGLRSFAGDGGGRPRRRGTVYRFYPGLPLLRVYLTSSIVVTRSKAEYWRDVHVHFHYALPFILTIVWIQVLVEIKVTAAVPGNTG